MDDKLIMIIIFVLMYVMMIFFSKYRVYAACAAAVIVVVSGIVPLVSVPLAVNWNVLMMMCGTMVVVYFFIQSKMPGLIADFLMEKSKNVMWVAIMISLFAGLISAFIDNVATVLMIAPVGIAICKKLKINPVPMILSIAVSSNLQGAATLVGDTTSILLGDYAGMDFTDFFWFHNRLSIFFTVEIGALLTIPVMMIIFRDYKQKVTVDERTKVEDFVPSIMLLAIVLLLIIASFNKDKPAITNGVICMCIALVTIVQDLIRHRKVYNAGKAVKDIDIQTLLMLTGIFIVVKGLSNTGLIEDMAAGIVKIGGDNTFLLYTIIVWASVLISAFVDNIPYVATMLPVVQSMAITLGVEPYLLYFGLLSGATLGGNLTPVGASANITGIGILKREGYIVGFKEFAKIGIPFTLTAVTAGYVVTWFIWS